VITQTNRASVIERALGSLGLFLLVLTGWAVERLQGRAPIDAVLARLVLECVTAVGWVIDRLPLPGPPRRDRAQVPRHVSPINDLQTVSADRLNERAAASANPASMACPHMRRAEEEDSPCTNITLASIYTRRFSKPVP
jgi:hypothetical protein